MANKHTTARIGKRIFVVLHDGTSFIDKLKNINSKTYDFEEQGRIQKKYIKTFAIGLNRNGE